MTDQPPTYATRAAFNRARMSPTLQAPTHIRQDDEHDRKARAPAQPTALKLPDPRPSFARPTQAPRSEGLEPWADLSAFAPDKRAFLEMRRTAPIAAQARPRGHGSGE